MEHAVFNKWFYRWSLALAGVLALGVAHGDLARGSEPADLQIAPRVPEQSGDWTYTVRPDDDLESISEQLLRQERNAQDLINYNGISSSRSLTPGDTLRVPLRWLEHRPRPAEATSVVGAAFVYFHLESARQQLDTGQKLNVGDEIRTATGRALVTLADGSVIRVSPHTRLTFDRLTQYGRTGMADTRMHLEKGRVNTRVETFEENGSRFEIETPSAVAAVRGTAFSLESRDNGTLLEVREGRVAFGNGQNAELVREGQSAFQGTDGQRTINPLDPAPRITSSPERVTETPIDLGWQGQSDNKRFQVSLFERKKNQWLIRQQTSRNAINLTDLTDGDYRLRVASIDDNGRRSRASTRDFVVRLQAQAAELKAPSEGATLDSQRPEFTWTRQSENEEARIEVARSGAFDDIVATSDWGRIERARLNQPLKAGEYYWRVLTRRGASSTATSQAKRFTMQPSLDTTRIISTNTIGNQVNLYWSSVDNAERYQVQVARDAAFNDIVSDIKVDQTETRLKLKPGARYHIRVKGQTSDATTSAWGDSHEIAVE